jgi:hypothetical protein
MEEPDGPVGRGGRRLGEGNRLRFRVQQDNIGKRAPDVDANPIR